MPEIFTLEDLLDDISLINIDENGNLSDEDKKINVLKSKLNNILDLIKVGKPFYSSIDYSIFMMSYNQLDDDGKDLFKQVYIDLTLETAKIKITTLLNNPMPSGNLDNVGIKAKVNNILLVDGGFDFGKFDNKKLNEIINN